MTSILTGCRNPEMIEADLDPGIMFDEDAANMHIGLGFYTYVSPLDAATIESGNIHDGHLIVNTSVAVLILDGAGQIVFAELNDLESQISFDESGTIIDESLPGVTRKEYEGAYRAELEALEEDLLGYNAITISNYYHRFEQDRYPNINFDDYYQAIKDAFLNNEPVRGIREIGLGVAGQYTMQADDQADENILKIVNTFAVISVSENAKVTKTFFDELETTALLNDQGQIVTNRFDTRGNYRRGQDVDSPYRNYVLMVDRLNDALFNKDLEKALTFFETDYQRLDIRYYDLTLHQEAYEEALHTLKAWY